MNSLIYSKCNGYEGALGGRHLRILNDYEQCFRKLIQSGAELVFFCDAHVRDSKLPVWCSKQNEHWNNLFVNQEEKWKDVFEALQRNKCHLLFENLVQMVREKNLGQIYTSTDVECDRAIIKYVKDRSVFAVISNDTDFLIFDVEYELWNYELLGGEFDVNNQTIYRINRSEFKNSLNMTNDEIKIMAIILGNDSTKPYKYGKVKINSSLLKFCRNTMIEDSVEILWGMIKKFKYDQKIGNNFDIIQKSLNFYNIERVQFPEQNENYNFMECAFKEELNLQYDVKFLDFKTRSKRPLIEILFDVFRKVGGIVLDNDRSKKLQIVTKRNSDQDYQVQELEPDYVSAEISNESSKWNQMLCVLGLDVDIVPHLDTLLQDSKNPLLTLLSIKFLLQVYKCFLLYTFL